MSLIWAIVIGFVVGLLARFLMPGRDPAGFIVTALLGIAGSLVATWIGRISGIYATNEAAGFVGALIGALIVLFIYNRVRGHRRAM